MTNQNIFTIGELTLVSGVGNYSEASACVMSAAAAIHSIEQGAPLTEATDVLSCACPVVRRLLIARNDGPWRSDEERTSWGVKLIPRIIGSKRDRQETIRRAFRCADVAVRVIASRALTESGFQEHGIKLSALPEVNAASAAYAADAADAAYASSSVKACTYASFSASSSVKASAYSSSSAASAAAYAVYACACASSADRISYWGPVDALIEEFLGITQNPLTNHEKEKLNLKLILK